MTGRSVHVRAPGKINIALHVGPAGEDGYHPLATVFQAVSLYEEVLATPASEIGLRVRGRHTEGVPTDESNLAWRAAALLAEATGIDAGVHLEVTKGVPTAGGMAGGSADAAATLLACDLLWGTGLSRDELGHLAAELGADVPFALTGSTAVGVGRGDLLSPALCRGTYWWVLALSEEGMSTPTVFGEWDGMQRVGGAREPTIAPELMQALLAADAAALAPHLHNDLQPAAVRLRPELGELLDVIGHTCALGAIVSGSGPTIAALADNPGDAADIAAAVTASGLAAEAVVVSGPVPGARLVEPIRSD